MESIFDGSFAKKQAIHEQIHGTGVGLSLVKRIVDGGGVLSALKAWPAAAPY